MPSTSKEQQRFMRLALAYKRGHVKDVSEHIKQVANSMTEEQLKHYTVLAPEEHDKEKK